MVLFFTSTAVTPPATIYMGRDKVENEDLIKYCNGDFDIWFHVDKLSSAHVYIKLPPDLPWGDWENLPAPLLMDLAQLVKANSIEGNKKNNVTVIYTPSSNLKKTGDMAVGQVSFHSDKRVKRVHVPARENVIVNRLNKTKVEREVDHESDRQERLRAEGRIKKAQAQEVVRFSAGHPSHPHSTPSACFSTPLMGIPSLRDRRKSKLKFNVRYGKTLKRQDGLRDSFREEAFEERQKAEEEDGDDFM